jgi:hypothetical protein
MEDFMNNCDANLVRARPKLLYLLFMYACFDLDQLSVKR